jgi:hypothetical protein
MYIAKDITLSYQNHPPGTNIILKAQASPSNQHFIIKHGYLYKMSTGNLTFHILIQKSHYNHGMDMC